MDFFVNHGWLFLVCIAIFPRLTIIFSTAIMPLFGILSWLGFIFAPHLLVAIYATTFYWHTNPGLCVIAWIFALGGTSAEGKYVSSRR